MNQPFEFDCRTSEFDDLHTFEDFGNETDDWELSDFDMTESADWDECEVDSLDDLWDGDLYEDFQPVEFDG